MNDVKSTPRLAPGYCNDAGLEAHHSGSDVVGIAFQPRRAASRLTGWWSSSLPRLHQPVKASSDPSSGSELLFSEVVGEPDWVPINWGFGLIPTTEAMITDMVTATHLLHFE